MSFSAVRAPPSPTPSSPSSPASSSPAPVAPELHGVLRALRANTLALQRLSATKPFDARRTRALRAQSRDLAAAAASLGAGGDEVQSALREFGAALRESVRAETEHVAALAAGEAGAAEGEGDGEGEKENKGEWGREKRRVVGMEGEKTALLASVSVTDYAAQEREVRGNEALMREREAALRDVHASVADVNAIFVDLAGMVGEQSSQVEYVELQLGDAAESVRNAKKELESGARRRENRKKLFFMTLFCIAGIFAVFLVLVLS